MCYSYYPVNDPTLLEEASKEWTKYVDLRYVWYRMKNHNITTIVENTEYQRLFRDDE